MRMPGTRITTLDGKTMELNPRPVDMPVTRPIGESLHGQGQPARRRGEGAAAAIDERASTGSAGAPERVEGSAGPRLGSILNENAEELAGGGEP